MNLTLDSEYRSFKKILNKFRIKLLLYKLIKGGIILCLSLFLLLSIYYFINSFFHVTVPFKFYYYCLLIVVVFIEFVLFFLFPVFIFFLSFSFKNNLILKQYCRYVPTKTDVFISVYNLAFHDEDISGDKYLKRAAFLQKYNDLNNNHLLNNFSNKSFLRQSFVFIFLISVGCFSYSFQLKQYMDLKDYKNVRQSLNQLVFLIQNESLNVEYGSNFEVKLKIISEDHPVGNVFICYGGGEFLMSKTDSLFTYNFDIVNNDLSFYFRTSDHRSNLYNLKVLPTPVITAYKVTYLPPSYSGLKPQILTNTVDFRVLYGSVLKFELNYSHLDSICLASVNRMQAISLKSDTKTDFTLKIKESGDYNLLGTNRYFRQKNMLNFNVTCIPDLYPSIQVAEIRDSLRNSLHYFYGVITDDYGFTDLRFNYAINGSTPTVVPVPIVKNTHSQEFYFSFDFAEFAGMEKAEIRYFFEVFDNDNISGPKSTRTADQNYLVPDLSTIFDYNVQADISVNTALDEVQQLAKEIVSDVKDLQRKLLDNTVDNWEKQQLAKDVVDKKKKLDKLLEDVKENNLKKSDLNKNFTRQDSALISKQKQIQDLLDKVMDQEMKDLMKEFSKLSEEFSKQKFQNLDEKMKLTFDQMSEELDRNIELLKRFQIEEKHDIISKQLEQLKANQEDFMEKVKSKAVDKDSIHELSKELQTSLEGIRQNYEHLLKENEDLSEPYSLNRLTPEFDQLSQDLSLQQEKSAGNKNEKKLSEKIKENIDKLSDKLKKQQQQNFVNKSLPENDIELIIQNILIISLSEEELLKQFPLAQVQSAEYNELGKLQDLKSQEYKIVKDSLSVLAKSNLMLASLLSHKFYDIEIKFGLLPGYIQDNKRAELAKEQQYIINYLNDIALSLTDALQKNKQSSAASTEEQNGKKGKNPSDDSGGSQQKKDGYGQMKKFQNSLKKQLEDLLSQMKNGERGKPLHQGISKMIRENELFKRSLEEFTSESGSLSPVEKQLLNEINQLLEENIRDLANYSVSSRLINRNNQIYNKLLISEKASREKQEFEEKRKAQVASEIQYKKPENIFKNKKKFGSVKADFQKNDLKLNEYFKTMYNNYYIRLGNE